MLPTGLHPDLYKGRRLSRTGILLSLGIGVMLVLSISFLLLEARAGVYRFDHSYFVDIEALDNETYLILCPLPVDSSGKLSHGFADDVTLVSGEVEIDVVATEHGQALRIVGYGPANITWSDRWDGDRDERLANLSTADQGGSDPHLAWAYCNQDGITIHLRSHSTQMIVDGTPRGFSINQTIDGTLASSGWQLMTVDSSTFNFV